MTSIEEEEGGGERGFLLRVSKSIWLPVAILQVAPPQLQPTATTHPSDPPPNHRIHPAACLLPACLPLVWGKTADGTEEDTKPRGGGDGMAGPPPRGLCRLFLCLNSEDVSIAKRNQIGDNRRRITASRACAVVFPAALGNHLIAAAARWYHCSTG